MLLGNILNSITLEDLVKFVITLGSFISAGLLIKKTATDKVETILDDKLQPFDNKMDDMEKARIKQHEETIKKVNQVQLYSDKNFLVRFLADVEQGNKIDEVEKERFYEVYKDYRELGGNSYIQHKVEKLQKEGKL